MRPDRMDDRRRPFDSWFDRLLAAAVILALAALIGKMAGIESTSPVAPSAPAVSESAK